MNTQAVVDYKYCFTDVMIKSPRSVHHARMFSTSTLSNDIQNGSILRCEKVIVEGEPAVPIYLLGDPAYSLLLCLMKELANRGKDESEESLVFAYSRPHGNRVHIWSIKSSFWLLKERNAYRYQTNTKSYKFMFCFKQFFWGKERAVESETYQYCIELR